ncbi:hypothetical protein J8273_6303 [Carpediemonas membranifera]|uniref:Uncharacterized protein n=1 Tax=Carpediemonas membranifera TaxID=201153 RepID=A0A8J6DY50_9EUKA|nr:hypothetical protein J8273_6303 [Carpediemonas membranifera]|eukprot:KAG9391539.1 hypothetical protein J8273_6303 [Carpediemonas membranifera]
MECSDLFERGRCIALSPNGQFISTSMKSAVIVIETETSEQIYSFSTPKPAKSLTFSPDSMWLAITFKDSDLVRIYNMEEGRVHTDFHCGPALCHGVVWAPSSTHILIAVRFFVQVIIYSLDENAPVSIIENCKSMNGMKYSEQGDVLAVLERTKGVDYLNVINTASYAASDRIQLPTVDAAGLAVCSSFIAVWDDPCERMALLFTAEGTEVGRLSISEESELGVRAASFSPDEATLALHGFDGSVYLLPTQSDADSAVLDHDPIIATSCRAPVYQEVEVEASGGSTMSRYETVAPPLSLHSFSGNGVSNVAWSPSGTLLATRSESVPHAVYVWRLSSEPVLVSILAHSSPVRTVRWMPDVDVLCLTTSKSPLPGSGMQNSVLDGGKSLFFWSEQGASVVKIAVSVQDRVFGGRQERPFVIEEVVMPAVGSDLLLCDSNHYTVCSIKEPTDLFE